MEILLDHFRIQNKNQGFGIQDNLCKILEPIAKAIVAKKSTKIDYEYAILEILKNITKKLNNPSTLVTELQ